MKSLDLQHIRNIVGIGTALANNLIEPLNKYLTDPRFEINTLARLSAFIANAAEETAGFTSLTEFTSGKEYEGRADLGNIHPGDGIKYKGRGIFQVTGQKNYAYESHLLYGDARLVATPELLAQPDAAVLSACWYWKTRNMNSIADTDPAHIWHVAVNYKAAEFTTFQWIVELINGGQNGYATRLRYYQNAMKIFADLF